MKQINLEDLKQKIATQLGVDSEKITQEKIIIGNKENLQETKEESI